MASTRTTSLVIRMLRQALGSKTKSISSPEADIPLLTGEGLKANGCRENL